MAIYLSPFFTFTFADIALFLIFPFLAVGMIRKNKINKNLIVKQFLIIILYMISQLLILSIFNNDSSFQTSLLSSLRLIFYYFIIAFFLKSYFDPKKGFKIYKKINVFVSLFLILQFVVLHVTGKYIPGFIPWFKVSDVLRLNALNMDVLGRVRSVFTEPSHFAIYCSLYLAIDLLSVSKKINIPILIVTFALLLSNSSTAIIMLVIIYGIFFLQHRKYIFSKYLFHSIFIIVCFMIFILIYMQTDGYKNFIYRTFESGTATEGRFGNYDLIFNDNSKNLGQMIFGEGLTKIDGYIPSIPRIYLYYGIIGMIYFIFISTKNMVTFKGVNRITLIIALILAFPTEFLFSVFILVYAPFLYLNFDNINENMIGDDNQ